jgi:uncharacterized protein with PIN domain
LEHAALITRIMDAGRDGEDRVDSIQLFSPQISALRDAAIAAELEQHAALLWDTAKMLEGTHAVLSANGDEQAAAIIDGQRRILTDLSAKLNRRAATLRPVPVEEVAARDALSTFTAEQADGEKLVFTRCVTCGASVTVTSEEAAMRWYDTHNCVVPEMPPIDIDKRRCGDCGQDIVVMEDGTLAAHRLAAESAVWCKEKDDPAESGGAS